MVMLGRQGAGKGTQCARLAEHFDVPHVSTGEMLRQAIDERTDLGRRARRSMDVGDLVPDDTMNEIVQHRLAREDVADGFILDGYPRTVGQAKALRTATEPRFVDVAVNIDVPVDDVIERLQARGRVDDTREAIGRRLELYEQETAPLIAWFTELGRFEQVDGLGDMDDVTERLVAAIDLHRVQA